MQREEKNHAGVWGYRAVEGLSSFLPMQVGYSLAKTASRVVWLFRPAIRKQVCRNLSQLTGKAPESFGAASRQLFCNFGFYLFETFAMHRLKEPLVVTEGLDHLEKAFRQNRGVIVLTAHLGNWELGSRVLQKLGFSTSAVALPHADRRLDLLFDTQRKRYGAEVIALDGNVARESLKALSRGRLLGLLADRDFMGDGIPVRVGQATMIVPRGPAVLSLRSQAPIVPVFLVREGWWRFRLICEPALWPAKESPAKQAVEDLVFAYTRPVEAMLKRYSDQWLMFQAAFQT